MTDQIVFIYSNFCKYCQQFLKVLDEFPDIAKHMSFLNIDVDPRTGKRPDVFFSIQSQLGRRIEDVPSLLVGQHILFGEQAFDWLQEQIDNNHSFGRSNNQDISGFNCNEMSAFSDSYSPYGNKNMHDNASEQTFKFISKPDTIIETPQEQSAVTQEEYNRKQKERESFVVPATTSSPAPQFTINSNSKSKSNSNSNKKQEEMDNRLRKL